MNKHLKSELSLLSIVMVIVLAGVFLVWLLFKDYSSSDSIVRDNLNIADYHGIISELDKGGFILEPVNINPEVDYNAPHINFSSETKVEGKVKHIEDLRNGHEVKLWAKENKGVKFADKIKVINE